MHIAANHIKIGNLFERIHLFLARLKIYTGMPLTNKLKEWLGNIMTELLTILALSTKEMTDGKISESIWLPSHFWSDYNSGRFLKWLTGISDLEDACRRLESLSDDDGRMFFARNLEVMHSHEQGTQLFITVFIQCTDTLLFHAKNSNGRD